MSKIINYQQGFKTKVNAERPMLMMPMNVVMTARIDGMINEDKLRSAVEALRERHAMLAVRIIFDDDNVAWYTTDGVPEIPVKVVTSETAIPEEIIKQEWMMPFSLETGPLVRITLIKNSGSCELIVTGHHVICDGTSLTYLISDILKQTSGKEISKEILPAPPPIDESTVPTPKKMNFIAKLVMNIISKKWSKERIAFTKEDR